MLIQFSIENFGSIRTRQTLSLTTLGMSADKDRLRLPTGFSDTPYVVPVCALFGANAAGKTSLLDGLQTLARLVRSSAKEGTPDSSLPIRPYKLTEETKSSPSTFEIVFATENYRFEYGVSATKSAVQSEWMFARRRVKRSKTQLVFERNHVEADRYEWKFGHLLPASKDVWKDATRANALFISTSVQLNSDFFREPFEWFTREASFLSTTSPDTIMTDELLKGGPSKKRIIQLLNAFDLRVSDIEISDDPRVTSEKFPKPFFDYVKAAMPKITFIREDEQGNRIEFDFRSEESSGTHSIYQLASYVILTMALGNTLIIDELNTNLHPNAFRHLVRIFKSKRINKKNAQLIFSTHDSSILLGQLLARDEIWFVNRSPASGTEITPLTEFSARREAALQRQFLSGRYGGVPILSNKLFEVFEFESEDQNSENN